MGNMSYCRFENTLSDLRDCQDAMDETHPSDLSDTERRARQRLIEICCEIAKDYGDEGM